MEPFFATLVSILILLVSRVAGMAADGFSGSPVVSTPGAEWVSWIEKVGTVGVCIWMLVWFQRRNDSQHAELAKITERAISALEHNAKSDLELAQAVTGLKEVIDDFHQ